MTRVACTLYVKAKRYLQTGALHANKTELLQNLCDLTYQLPLAAYCCPLPLSLLESLGCVPLWRLLQSLLQSTGGQQKKRIGFVALHTRGA